MDKFREIIKRRMIWGVIIVLISTGLGIFDQTGLYDKIWFIKRYEVVSAFQLGFITGIGLVAIVMMFKYGKALKDTAKLQLLYNKEYDERLELIRHKSGMPMLMITSGIMIFSGIIAGYLNQIIFYTLIMAAVIQMALGAIVKMYYIKKL